MLSQNDIRKFSEFLRQIYTVAVPEDLMFQLPLLLQNIVPSEVPVYVSVNYQERKVTFINSPENPGLVGQVIHNCDDHPRASNFIQTGDLSAQLISDALTEYELHQLEGVYHSYLKPMGMEEQLTLYLPPFLPVGYLYKKRLAADSVGLHRSERSFTDRDKFILNLLLPHIMQAQQNAIAFITLQQALAQSNQALEQAGILILTADEQVRSISQRAINLLNRYFYTSANQLPDTLRGWFRHQLTLLNPQDEITSPCLPLQIEQEGRRLTIRFICDRSNEQYLLLLEEQPLRAFSIETLELLGLTQREAEVLFWVAKDKNNAEIAAILGCRSGTVKKHLEHVFEKLGVRTRTGAVMIALEQLGLFRI